MENEGIVLWKVVSERLIVVIYELIEFGRMVLYILEKLRIWLENNDV